jgi:exportin-1
MISAQPNKPQQEKLIAKLMELPNNAVRSIWSCLRIFALTFH